jgi:hypothetical protein
VKAHEGDSGRRGANAAARLLLASAEPGCAGARRSARRAEQITCCRRRRNGPPTTKAGLKAGQWRALNFGNAVPAGGSSFALRGSEVPASAQRRFEVPASAQRVNSDAQLARTAGRHADPGASSRHDRQRLDRGGTRQPKAGAVSHDDHARATRPRDPRLPSGEDAEGKSGIKAMSCLARHCHASSARRRLASRESIGNACWGANSLFVAVTRRRCAIAAGSATVTGEGPQIVGSILVLRR